MAELGKSAVIQSRTSIFFLFLKILKKTPDTKKYFINTVRVKVGFLLMIDLTF
jgi:hypothetical protein